MRLVKASAQFGDDGKSPCPALSCLALPCEGVGVIHV